MEQCLRSLLLLTALMTTSDVLGANLGSPDDGFHQGLNKKSGQGSFQSSFQGSDRSSDQDLSAGSDPSCWEPGVEYHGGGLPDPMVSEVGSPEMCQSLCQARTGCLFFTWVGPTSDVEFYRLTCWLKGSQGTPQDDPSCVSGPVSCASESCCSQVSITSLGPTADYQGPRLGHYSYGGELSDRPYYQQTSSPYNYLYYLDGLGVWYIGDDLGANMGGMINWGDSKCPDQLEEPWSFYEWGDGTSNDWAEDPYLSVNCETEEEASTEVTTTEPATTEPERTTSSPSSACTFGAACAGCDVTQELNGQVYCCASECDSGQIYVWEDENGVHCNCAH